MNFKILTSDEEFAVNIETFFDRRTGRFHHIVTRGTHYYPSEERVVREFMRVQEVQLEQRREDNIITLIGPLSNKKGDPPCFYCYRN